MFVLSKCYSCKNWLQSEDSVVPKCRVYPNGIPLEIFRRDDETVRCKDGIKYTVLDGGTLEERLEEVKCFLGLEENQTFQDLG